MFHTKQRHMDAVSFTINKENIYKISSFNFLGIHLDENLTWNKYIDMLTNKLSRVLIIIIIHNICIALYNALLLSAVVNITR